MEERKFFVYEHVNKINNKRYVGITKREKPEYRFGKNGCNYKECTYFYSAIEKYGWDNFEHNILFEGLTRSEAIQKEKELIKTLKLQDREFGYNIQEGGNTPRMPDSVRKKISIAMKGNKNGLGVIFSEERKRHLSESQKGRKFSEDHKRRISEAKKGKPTKPCPEDVKKKISDSYPHKRKILCLENNKIYNSIHDCARELDLNVSNISAVCRGKFLSTKKYHFKYYDK